MHQLEHLRRLCSSSLLAICFLDFTYTYPFASFFFADLAYGVPGEQLIERIGSGMGFASLAAIYPNGGCVLVLYVSDSGD